MGKVEKDQSIWKKQRYQVFINISIEVIFQFELTLILNVRIQSIRRSV